MKRINQISSEKKMCGQCRYFACLNPHVCETLNLSRIPFSLWFRLRLGYGAHLRKKKMVRHRARMCSDYEENRFLNSETCVRQLRYAANLLVHSGGSGGSVERNSTHFSSVNLWSMGCRNSK